MVIKVEELAKMGHVSKRRLQTYEEFIESYKQYKVEKVKLPVETKHMH